MNALQSPVYIKQTLCNSQSQINHNVLKYIFSSAPAEAPMWGKWEEGGTSRKEINVERQDENVWEKNINRELGTNEWVNKLAISI